MFNTAKVGIYFQTSKPKVLKILKLTHFLAKNVWIFGEKL